MWEGDWTKIPMGMPGLETLLPLTYTRGVLGGRLSIEDMCMKLSTNPARIMGLAPRKGSIAIGADADLAIIHPTRTHRVDPDDDGDERGLVAVRGVGLAGFARTTVSRGEVIVDNYRVVGRGRTWGLASSGIRESGIGNRRTSGRFGRGAPKPPEAVPIPDSRFPIPASAR